ncbi:MAG: hypothetical protein JW867_07345 [Candidatus Omnitrophica bacterium]|nr:hypothetical protein [Candidatus Omnitrophota bacterium]
MRKRSYFIILLAIIILGFIFSPLIIKKLLIRYIDEKFSAATAIESLSFSLDKIKLKEVDIKSDDFRFKLGEAEIDFSFEGFLKPELGLLKLSGPELKITDLDKFRQNILVFAPVSADNKEKKQKPQVFKLSLDNASLAIDESPELYLGLEFSFRGSFAASELIDLKNLKIDRFDYRNKAVSLSFDLEQVKGRNMILHLDSIKHEDREIKNISLPLEIGKDSITLKESPLYVLGEGNIEGKLQYTPPDNFCVNLILKSASFNFLIEFLGQDKNVIFRGPFAGVIDLCFKAGQVLSFDSSLESSDNGVVHLRKEVTFDFLKQYLDKKSLKELVDSFNNYTYNSGKIGLKMKGDTISVHFDFFSQSRGRRNVEINYHLPQGG